MGPKILHTADWHILDIQYGRTFRGADYRKAALEVVESAIRMKVDMIINGGDTLDRNRPSGKMLDTLFEIDSRLREAGIPMFTVTGNHDDADPSFLTLPGYRRVEGKGGLVCIDWKVVEHDGVTIAGCPAVRWEEAAEWLDNLESKPDILVWHGAVREFCGFPVESAPSYEELAKRCGKAALLGDIHVNHFERDGDILVGYPGSVELRERGEQSDKSFNVYELADDWKEKPFPDPLSLPIATRPVLFLRASDKDSADSAVTRAREAMETDDRPPMIFMTYNWEQRDVVGRLMASVDRTKTVVRCKLISPTFGGSLYESPEAERATQEARKPKLENIASQVIVPGSVLYGLTQALVDPDADARGLVSEFADGMLAEEPAAEEGEA